MAPGRGESRAGKTAPRLPRYGQRRREDDRAQFFILGAILGVVLGLFRGDSEA
jgi:hypothetical protein